MKPFTSTSECKSHTIPVPGPSQRSLRSLRSHTEQSQNTARKHSRKNKVKPNSQKFKRKLQTFPIHTRVQVALQSTTVHKSTFPPFTLKLHRKTLELVWQQLQQQPSATEPPFALYMSPSRSHKCSSNFRSLYNHSLQLRSSPFVPRASPSHVPNPPVSHSQSHTPLSTPLQGRSRCTFRSCQHASTGNGVKGFETPFKFRP